MKVNSIIATLLFAVLSTSASAADWAKYQSHNFTVYSDWNERRVIELIREFELFRIIAMRQLGLPDQGDDSQKMTIVLFGDRREYRRMLGSRDAPGFYTRTKEGPRMVLGPVQRDLPLAKEMLFSSYTGHLISEYSPGFNYPRWYRRGMSMMLGSAKIESDSVILGGPPTGARQIGRINLLSMRDLLSNRLHQHDPEQFEYRHAASSWILTHYLQINALVNERELGLKNRSYLTRYHAGDEPIGTFTEEFGTTLEEFETRLKAYARQSRIPVINWPLPDLELELIKHFISDSERAYVMADILFSTGQEDTALSYLEDISRDGNFAGEAISLKAVMLNHDGSSPETAELAARQAAEIAPGSSNVFANLAHFEMDSYRRLISLGQYALAIERLDLAEAYARRGVELDASEFYAYWYLASVMLARGRDGEALETLTQAMSIMPSHMGVRIEIAKLLLRAGNFQDALPLVRSVIGVARSPVMAEMLVSLVDQIQRGDVNLSQLEQLVGPAF